MKRAWLLVLLLAVGCEKKHKDAQVGGMPGGGGVTSVAHYSGALTPQCSPCTGSDNQDVATNADVINFPNDSVAVFMCRVQTSCTTLPAVQCSAASPGQACYTSTPSSHIIYGHNIVRFSNAPEDGYVSYSIDTTVTR